MQVTLAKDVLSHSIQPDTGIHIKRIFRKVKQIFLSVSNIRCSGRIIRAAIMSILLVTSTCATSAADEKIGNLVFKTMNALSENHQVFLKDLKVVRNKLNKVIATRDAVKNEFQKADPGSLDWREFHAEFSLAQANIYHTIYDEAVLTQNIAKKQIGILTKLNDQIESGEAVLTNNAAAAVIEVSKPLLKNGRLLLSSLAQYRHKISDPVINSKLNSAYKTASMLSQYVTNLESGRTSQFSSQKILKQKLASLINQLTALYVQTNILKDMIKDKTMTLKMINELAAAEMVIIALGDGEKTTSDLIDRVMVPMMEAVNADDENLDLLAASVHSDGGIITAETYKMHQHWASGF